MRTTSAAPPFITVVMPVRNEADFIGRILGELLSQRYPPDRYEIIVADGESTDATREVVGRIAERHPQVKLLPNPGRLSSAGRNVGFRNGRGDLFVVVDGHCVIGHLEFLANVAECFERSGAACLARPQPFILPEAPTMQRAIGVARTSRLGHSTASSIHDDEEGYVSPVSSGCAYTREVFATVGFVDESFDACEDVEFNYRVERAGMRTFFTPKVALQYYPRQHLTGLWRQLQRYGHGRVRFVRKHPECLGLDMMVPPLFVAGLVAGPLLGFVSSWFLYAYAATVALYVALTGGEALRLARGRPIAFAFKVWLALCTTHLALGSSMIAGAWKALRRRR